MKGIDIYVNSDITSWEALKAAGIQVVYIKATEGRTYQNTSFKAQYEGAKNAGLLVGAYHFAGKVSTVDQEYSNFINTIKGYQFDLKPCLDYEIEVNPSKAWCDTFMAKDPNLLFYGSQSIVAMCKYSPGKVWVAMPDTSSPKDTGEYAGIQYSWTGTVNGLNGNADLDLFSNAILVNNVVTTAQKVAIPVSNVNEAIRQLQSNFNLLKIADLVTDGIQGINTTNTIMKFQTLMSLKCDGVLGPNTQAAISAILVRPVDGVLKQHYNYATRYIQWRTGSGIDGTFGSDTEAKVKIWQGKNELTADGVVGLASWTKLL